MEAAGLTISVLGLIGSAFESYKNTLSENRNDYGHVRALALETVFFQARGVVDRIRRHVLERPEPDFIPADPLSSVDPAGPKKTSAEEAWSIKESYADNFNMIAVAGAIVAQIAITALSLEYLEQTHWTASAAFVISLVAGLLSVYFACILQQQLSSLHSPKETERWLTAVRVKRNYQDDQEKNDRKSGSRIVPSFNASLLLVVPSILLNWSSISLLIGIGIYYGLVETESLGSLRGSNANLAILLVYVIFTSGALVSYIYPWWQKELDAAPQRREELKRMLEEQTALLDEIERAKQGSNRPRDVKLSKASLPQGSREPRRKAMESLAMRMREQARSQHEHQPVSRHDDEIQPIGSATSQALIARPGSKLRAEKEPSTSQQHADQGPSTQRPASTSGSMDPHLDSGADAPPATFDPSTANPPVFEDIDTKGIVDALKAAISAQKTSLHAHNLLLRMLQNRETSRPAVRSSSV